METDAEDSQKAFESILSFVPALVLKSALLLEIPDIIAREGPSASLSLHEIAARLPTQNPHLDYLSRILRYLSARGVFVESQAGDENRYALSNSTKHLFVKENNPWSLVPVVLMQTHEVLMAPWHHLHECVLEGCHAFQKAHGKDIWEYGKDNPHVNNILNDCMASFTLTTMKQILNCFQGFKELDSIVDVGGGKGAALGEIVKAHPHIRGINFDLPHVVATAPPIPGIQHVGGNMFHTIPSAHAIFMKNVLHDWDDESCVKILQNCHKVLPENGKLILAEIVVPHPSEKCESADMVGDLVMIAHSNGGRERSKQEWSRLLQRSSFCIAKIVGLPGMVVKMKIIEATKLKMT